MKICTLVLSLAVLAAIMWLAVWVRLGTLDSPTVLDYDPFYFERMARTIMDNGLRPPSFDLLSFYPPGRPISPFQGWPYTMIAFYHIASWVSPHIAWVDVAKLAPVIMAALIPIPTFLLGRLLTNKWGGLTTALFACLSPALIGTSMAGYCDTDVVVVFYTFLCTWLTFLALRKSSFKWTSIPIPTLRTIPYLALAILGTLLFVWNWGAGWLPLIIFMVFIPTLIVFRLAEQVISTGTLKTDLAPALRELRGLLPTLVVIMLISNLLGHLLGFNDQLGSLAGGLAFTGLAGQPLLVNISVAELQPLNPFTRDGFAAVVGRVGLAPVILTFVALPALVGWKVWRRVRIDYAEVFLFLWALVMFVLISRGVRFALLFSCAAATAAGYVIGNLTHYLKPNVVGATTFGLIALLILMFISDAVQLGYAGAGMLISQNWYEALDWLRANADPDALIATWWDPGHIIAGYTGLKVHADGAHCPPGECIPYNHNVRIQDMGRIFSTSSEQEAVAILDKYRQLTPEQIRAVKMTYGDRVPDEAFTPVSEVYLIASSDLIGKYYWMSYFGTGTGQNFIQLPFTGGDVQGRLTYGGGVITLTLRDGRLVPRINLPQQGIVNRVIGEIVYWDQGVERHLEIANVTDVIDGLVWVDPGFGAVIFMPPQIRDSLFTRLFFFNGRGLEHFELKFTNPEVRIYKVLF